MKKETEQGLMTEGSIPRLIIAFSLPLILGNLFQQMYNTVDSIIVGRFIGGTALAAVGCSAPVVGLLIGMFMGLTSGASVIISQHYGAGRLKEVKEAIHTTIFFSAVFGILLSVAGYFLVDHVLLWIDTPPEVFPQASAYLRVFFAGIFCMGMYNTGAAILRGMGDSRSPLYYLAVVCVLNIVLDVLFVVVFHTDVEGAAIATIIAQGAASVLVLRKMRRLPEEYRLEFSQVRCHWSQLRMILKVGIPTGIQSMIISLSNVLVQGAINGFGADTMAGWGAYSKLDTILLMPFQSFGIAMTTFTGQNIGARRLDRVSGAVRSTAAMSCGWSVLSGVILYVLSEPAMRIFCEETAVVEIGVYILRLFLPYYFLLGLNQVFAGAINGSGDTTATMAVSIGNMCVLRILILKIMPQFTQTFMIVFCAYVVTWFTCAFCQGMYYFSGRWKRLVRDPSQDEEKAPALP